MTTHAELHPFLRPLLDRVLEKCRSLTWPEREELVGAAIVAIFKGQTLSPGMDPDAEFPRFIAAVIDRLGAPPVVEESQALLYSLSSMGDHVEAGESWMDEHSEETALLTVALRTDGAS
ncbi:hypothetical protein [Azospirillum picis]|uniref:Uncharacterized protein n=1 Tax=Azospirillum picis TaxID=488438 RepID=A0ABU0MKB4_9PROT|nr:hypothetical protein [Azospirillum picis]MBP2299860.1 hypothetical protein [Azospirillum picis]MDQ0533656.1 hypothetical protein [Azospirillum picis]